MISRWILQLHLKLSSTSIRETKQQSQLSIISCSLYDKTNMLISYILLDSERLKHKNKTELCLCFPLIFSQVNPTVTAAGIHLVSHRKDETLQNQSMYGTSLIAVCFSNVKLCPSVLKLISPLGKKLNPYLLPCCWSWPVFLPKKQSKRRFFHWGSIK